MNCNAGPTSGFLARRNRPTKNNLMSLDAHRVKVDGKFFRLSSHKFYVKGITYGPFAPNGNGEFFASPEQTGRDFKLIAELGANVIRVYYVPPKWLLDLAAQHG